MVKIFSAYLFFFLLVFTLLSIGVSEFSKTFAQLFYFLCKDSMIYGILVHSLYALIALLGIFYILFSYYFPHPDLIAKTPNFQNTHLLKVLVASGVSVIFFFIWIFSISGGQQDVIQPQQVFDIAFLDFWELLKNKLGPIFTIAFFTLFFLYLPLLFWIFSLRFDLTRPLHRLAYPFFPSINVCILTLVASAIQPYYDKLNFYLYIDLFVFLVALVLLLWVFIKKRYLFQFYEFMNLLLLVFMIYFVMLSSDVLANANSFHVRHGFYLFAFFVWCCEWMFEDFFANR